KQVGQGRRPRSYPEDTGAAEDAAWRSFAAARARGNPGMGRSVQLECGDLVELELERAPEAAAVAREVEPAARREEDRVRVLARERDGEAGREAAARLVPGHARVVGDDERRPAVDDGDDGRARGRGGDDTRQADGGRRRPLEAGAPVEGGDRALVQV